VEVLVKLVRVGPRGEERPAVLGRQDAGTRQMMFGVAEIVHYVSQFKVPHPGDVVELEISGLGRQRQTVGQA
jgi:2-keto-4-pentenoate hydratase/2-oxohepta-3-ene-1,7-dioic acid hydratase in catechol pathway